MKQESKQTIMAHNAAQEACSEQFIYIQEHGKQNYQKARKAQVTSIIYQKIRSRPLRVFSLLQFKLRVQTVINSHRVWIMQPTVQKVPYLKEEVLNEQILSIAYCTIVR